MTILPMGSASSGIADLLPSVRSSWLLSAFEATPTSKKTCGQPAAARSRWEMAIRAATPPRSNRRICCGCRQRDRRRVARLGGDGGVDGVGWQGVVRDSRQGGTERHRGD
jgi:hypothetical protein